MKRRSARAQIAHITHLAMLRPSCGRGKQSSHRSGSSQGFAMERAVAVQGFPWRLTGASLEPFLERRTEGETPLGEAIREDSLASSGPSCGTSNRS